jgi:hypothetical protein
MIKYQLPTGEVIELDVDDYLDIDNTTIDGKKVMQDILNFKDTAKKWDNADLAESEDSLKFIDKEQKIIDVSLEEFEGDIYKQILKDKDLL